MSVETLDLIKIIYIYSKTVQWVLGTVRLSIQILLGPLMLVLSVSFEKGAGDDGEGWSSIKGFDPIQGHFIHIRL